MSEILFRGKTVNGDWVYGGITWNPSRKKVFIHTKSGECEVIPKTVGQYTGLKDKKGTRIFDGDIVDVNNALLSGRFWVKYSAPGGAFIVKDKDDRRFFLGGCNCTVIGNIFDNPELLEGKT